MTGSGGQIRGRAIADQTLAVIDAELAPLKPKLQSQPLGCGVVRPSLSTSGETLTIEESMTLRARMETAGDVEDEHEWSWSRSRG
jgi:hypothetical protein